MDFCKKPLHFFENGMAFNSAIIDGNHPLIGAHAEKTVNDSNDPVGKALTLYYAVQDGIWYEPYYPFYLPKQLR
ncbi:hypothetical protein ACFL0M_08860 [Thermodesulfobacteriota bacterium]